MNTSTRSRNPSTVLVFGHSGFVGGAIAKHLLANCFPVQGASSRECDLLDPSSVQQFLNRIPIPYQVVFCAAIARRTEDSDQTAVENKRMVMNLAAALRKQPPESLIYFSSVDVYGPSPVLPLKETNTLNPQTPYGRAKREAEQLLLKEFPPSFPLTILRLPGIFGPGDQGDSVIGRFAAQLRQDKTITLTGNPQTRRDFVPVSNVCRLVERLLRNPIGDIINVAMGQSYSLEEWVQKIASALDETAEIRNPKSAIRDDLVFDISHLKERFPDFSIEPADQVLKAYVHGN